jgi:hypothetical protein
MKKLVVISLLLCLAFALPPATGFAQSGDDSVVINPYQQDYVTVSTNDDLILGFGWAACTPGLVQAYITAAHYQWTLDGDPIFSGEETAQYFGPIYPLGACHWCLIGNGTGWMSSFRYSIGTLTPGTYEIRLLHRLDHPVIDGADLDGDGRLDRREGEVEYAVTVHVVEGP